MDREIVGAVDLENDRYQGWSWRYWASIGTGTRLLQVGQTYAVESRLC